ncbi:MAG TPA: FecR domain-containing protein, partial [Salinimicrobium sp.]|nr:FecR domain-containing protein [Salinimicrobium sp.]
MNLKEAEILIEKFIHHQLTREEADELLQWLEKDNNEEVFNNHIGINYLLRNKVLDFDSIEAYAKIQKFLKPKKNKNPEWIAILKYAAIFIGIIGVGFYFLKPGSSGNNQELVPNYVTLEMENGKIEKINSEDQKSIYNNEGQLIGTKKKNSLNYETDSPIKNLVYNTLRIPNGKIFELILSDGSQVILNSGTTITYPVHFLPNKKRTVYLAGEAFFKVAKDSLNQFVVNTKNQKVVVYGTRFNVSA